MAVSSSPLESFVASLTQAWRKLLLYPENHPSRRDAIEAPYQTLRTLLAITGGFEIGIAEQELVIGEAGFNSPGAAELAHTLYQRNVAILRFEEGLTSDDLMRLLLALRPQPTGVASLADDQSSAMTFSEQLDRDGVAHVRIETVDYQRALADQVLVDDTFDAALERPRTLWSRILRRWLGHREAGIDEEADFARVLELLREQWPAEGTSDAMAAIQPELVESIDQLADAICEHLGIATDVERGSAPSPAAINDAAAGQAQALFEALPPLVRVATLEAALANLAMRDAFSELGTLESVAQPDDVVAALRRLRNRGFAFSPEGLALVERLVRHRAERRAGRGSKNPDDDSGDRWLELLASDTDRLPHTLSDRFLDSLPPEVLRGTFGGETAAGGGHRTPQPSIEGLLDLGSLAPPEALRRLIDDLFEILEEYSQHRLEDPRASSRDPSQSHDIESDVTVLPVTPLLQRIEAAARDLVSRHAPEAATEAILRLRHLQATVEDSSSHFSAAISRSLDRLASDETAEVLIEMLSGALSDDLAPLRELAETLGPNFLDRLVAALGDVEDRSLRRQLLSFLESMGASLVAPHAAKRLADDRWFVVRNMVALLNHVDDRTAIVAARSLLGHPDSRVGLEALRYLGRLDPELPAAALEPILDGHDSQLLERSLVLFGRFRMRAAVAPLVEIANAFDPLNRKRAQRMKAIESLGLIGDPGALDRLDSYFSTGVSRHSLEERRAAFQSLAGYPVAARAELVERGLRSRDTEIVSICNHLAVGSEPLDREAPTAQEEDDD